MELRDVFRFNSKHLLGSLNPTLTFYFKCRKHRKTFFKCFLHLKRNSISESRLGKIGMGPNRCPHEWKLVLCIRVGSGSVQGDHQRKLWLHKGSRVPERKEKATLRLTIRAPATRHLNDLASFPEPELILCLECSYTSYSLSSYKNELSSYFCSKVG